MPRLLNKKLFREFVPVQKDEYDKWLRIKTEYQQTAMPAWREILSMVDKIAGLEGDANKDLTFEERQRLRALLQNRFLAARQQLPTTDPFNFTLPQEHNPPGFPSPTKNPAAPPPPPSPVEQLAVKRKLDESESVKESAGEERVKLEKVAVTVDDFPEVNDKKALQDVLDLISSQPGRIRINKDNGKLVIDGLVVPRSNANHLIQSLFSRKASHNRTGLDSFLMALSDLAGGKENLASLIRDPISKKRLETVSNFPSSHQKGKAIIRSSSDSPPGKRILRLYE
jgi:hypothetical protein